ncbi:hypothetical protein [Pelagicoccus albus]|uniref:Uncharacterized protein n=1 Tax=Pelagicoccus albus TaxID=415222 RepID=A0A7X1B6C5_9BACT|nr:hypothetical protein [Pelagicoccus albus]MBC2606362.1 hypothetical protein [Pelagicoccus albus]
MDWLLENLGKLAPVVIFIIYIINALKTPSQSGEDEPDPEAQERARKIQEEIRRKILERQGKVSSIPEPDAGPTVIEFDPEPESYREIPSRIPEPVPVPVPVEQSEPIDFKTLDPYAKRREEIERKMEQAKRMERVAREKVSRIRDNHYADKKSLASTSVIREKLNRELKDQTSLKTAFVLREVLDKPLGMR